MVKAVVFDAYGTLLDVHGAMQAHEAALGAGWQAISQDWRAKQLEYSWVAALTGQYRDFWELTRAALRFAAAKHGIADQDLLDRVALAYRRLPAYPEVSGVLGRLRAGGLPCAILSNGEPAMLEEGVRAAGLRDSLDDVLSVHGLRRYKPAQPVYRLATDRFDAGPEEIAFLSSNPWDAFGAQVFGFRVFWVNRNNLPVEYGLDDTARIIPDLTPLPDLL